jgi:polar amino acid transport system permease protein
MTLSPEMMGQYLPLMLSGLLVTTKICAAASIIAMLAGLILALLLMSRHKIARWSARVYVETIRGLPILVILFLLYFGGPSVNLTLEAEPVGILGLGFYGAAYFAEIFRAGFLAIPPGQMEAAHMVGMSKTSILLRIQLPQMLGLIVPPSVNQIIILVKESAVLSTITIAELTKNAAQMANETFAVIEPHLFIAALYWLLIEAISRLGVAIERRVHHV